MPLQIHPSSKQSSVSKRTPRATSKNFELDIALFQQKLDQKNCELSDLASKMARDKSQFELIKSALQSQIDSLTSELANQSNQKIIPDDSILTEYKLKIKTLNTQLQSVTDEKDNEVDLRKNAEMEMESLKHHSKIEKKEMEIQIEEIKKENKQM